MIDDEGLLVRRSCPEEPAYSVVVEDDRVRVAYAYLEKSRKIVSDVWLYDHGDPPEPPEWKRTDARDRLPFKNAAGLTRQVAFAPIAREDEVTVRWATTSGGQRAAEVWIRGTLHARLVEGTKPGACMLAAKDGPVARALR